MESDILLGLLVVLAAVFFAGRAIVRNAAKTAAKWIKQDQKAKAIRFLEVVTHLPAIAGAQAKTLAQYQLLIRYYEEKRYADSVRLCSLILKSDLSRRSPLLEGDVRRRYAECLEETGEFEAVARERPAGLERLEKAKGSFLVFYNRAKLLEREGRYSESVEEYAKTLPLAPNPTLRRITLSKLTITSFNGGHMYETIKWAEEAIAEGLEGVALISAHRLAGLASSNLRQFEQAERYFKSSLAAAQQQKDAGQEAKCAAMFAKMEYGRGNLLRAIAMCEQSLGVNPEPDRLTYIILYKCYLGMGEWDRAEKALNQSREATPVAFAHYERRSQAIMDRGLATLYALSGRPQLALGFIGRAKAVFGSDEKVGLWCDMNAAWIRALLGEPDEALREMQALEEPVNRLLDDHDTQTSFTSLTGWVAYLAQDFSLSRQFWTRYLAQEPDPVYEPRAYYFLGECSLAIGDEVGARESFQKAVDMGIETFDVRSCRKRLDEMSSP